MEANATPPPRRQGGRLGRYLAAAAVVLTVFIAVVAAVVGWLGWTESGLHAAVRLAGWASGGELRIDGDSGRLAGPFSATTLRFRSPNLWLRIDGLTVEWHWAALLDRTLSVDRLAVATVTIASRPDEADTPVSPPASLVLPIAVDVRAVAVDRLMVLDWAAVADGDAGHAPPEGPPQADAAQGKAVTFRLAELRGALASDGRHHRIRMLAATLPFGRAALAGEIGGASPFPLNLTGAIMGERDGRAWQLDAEADGDLLAPRLTARARGAGLTGRAEVLAAPFAPVPLRELRVALGDIDPAAFVASAPHAALHVEAELAPVSDSVRELAGPLRIVNRRADTVDHGGVPIEALATRLRWTPAELDLGALEVDLLGRGRLAGSLAWLLPPGASPLGPDAGAGKAPADLASAYGRLTAALTLSGVEAHRLDTRLPAIAVGGRLDAVADEQGQKVDLDLRAGDARLSAKGTLGGAARASATPPQGGAAQSRPFSLSAQLRKFNPRNLFADAPQAELNLDVDADGQLGAAPRARVVFEMPTSRLDGRPMSGKGRLSLAPRRVADADLDLEFAGNRLAAQGAWGQQGDRLDVQVEAPALAALGHGLSGRAGLEGTLAGTPAEPAGTASVFAEALTLPGGVHLDGMTGQVELEAGLDGPFRLALGLSGLGPADRSKPDWIASGHVAADGSRRHHVVELAAEGLEADRVTARLEGGLGEDGEGGEGKGAAALRWHGRIAELQTEGRFSSRLVAPAALVLGAAEMSLGRAELEAGQQGRIVLEETRWMPQLAVLRGHLTGLTFGLTAQPEGRPRRGPGALVLGAEWDLRLADTINGAARLYREAGDLVVSGEIPTRLGLEQLETRLAVTDNRLALSIAARGTEFGELDGSATAYAERTPEGAWRLAPDQALLGSARLNMPSIAWMGRLMQENVATAGSLDASFSLSGTPAEPVATGRVRGHALELVLADQGLRLSGGELVADFDRDRLRLSRLDFVSPNRVRPRDSRLPVAALTRTPGTLRASGEIALDSGAGRFRFVADRLPLLQRADRWLIVSGDGSIRSTWTSADISAVLRADAGYIEAPETPPPSLSEDVVVVGREEARAGGAFALTADVRVGLGDHFYLTALGVDTRLAGELRLHLAPGVPLQATGTITTVGGTYRGYGQTLTIERGQITFQGALDNPVLNVVALRKGLEVEAGLAITGTARRPTVQLVSEPPVPDPEKLSWLVLGRPPNAASGGDLSVLLPAAQALLGGPGGGITDQLSRSLGLDQLSIGEGELTSATRAATSQVVGGGSTVTGESTVSGQVLSLGKRLSTDLFLSFEHSLAGAESLVKLTYQLGRRVSLVARGGTDNAVDLYYTFSFR